MTSTEHSPVPGHAFPDPHQRRTIFFTVALVLLSCWGVGLLDPMLFGRVVHVLPGAAVLMFLLGVFEGRQHDAGAPR